MLYCVASAIPARPMQLRVTAQCRRLRVGQTRIATTETASYRHRSPLTGPVPSNSPYVARNPNFATFCGFAHPKYSLVISVADVMVSARRRLATSFPQLPPDRCQAQPRAESGPGPGREILPARRDVIFVAAFVGEGASLAAYHFPPCFARLQVKKNKTILGIEFVSRHPLIKPIKLPAHRGDEWMRPTIIADQESTIRTEFDGTGVFDWDGIRSLDLPVLE
jgi:hypothetical protein